MLNNPFHDTDLRRRVRRSKLSTFYSPLTANHRRYIPAMKEFKQAEGFRKIECFRKIELYISGRAKGAANFPVTHRRFICKATKRWKGRAKHQ